MPWRKGRGKLGLLAPLIGSWIAHAQSPRGEVHCTRSFRQVLGGSHIELHVNWQFADVDASYEELALFGVGKEGEISFWSFTSDGKQSNGVLVEAPDVHPQAIAFEADMPAGRARMLYWPDDDTGFYWAVEPRTKKGWNRFTDHHYRLYVAMPEGEIPDLAG